MKQNKFIKISISLTVTALALIYVHAQSANVGQRFSVGITCGNNEGLVSATASNANVISSGNWCDRGKVINVEAVSNSEGTATISLVANDVSNTDGTALPSGTVIGSASVKIVSNNQASSNQNSNHTTRTPAEQKSGDNSLASLSVESGELNPTFDPSVTKYDVSLPADATAIVINAQANDQNASVLGTGERALKPGDNELFIKVTAQNGVTKDYQITVHVDETPTIFLDYQGKKLGVVKNTDNIVAPDMFETTTIKLNDGDITAWHNPSMNKTIIYLQDDTGVKNFYLYEEGKGVTSIFIPTALLGHNMFIVDLTPEQQVRLGCTYTDVVVDDKTMKGFVFDDPELSDYCLIYVMNESGEMVYYQYEKTENTLQLYVDGAPIGMTQYQKDLKKIQSLKHQNIILMIISVVCGLIIIATIISVYMMRKKIEEKIM